MSKHFKSGVASITLLKQLVLVEIMARIAHMGNKLNRCFIKADKNIKGKQTKTNFC